MNTTIASSLFPEVQEFLAEETFASFVGGKPVHSENDTTFTTFDPGSGERLAEVHDLQPNDVARAVDVANEAFRKQPWAQLAPERTGRVAASTRRRRRKTQTDHRSDRSPRCRQDRSASPGGCAEFCRHPAVLHRLGPARSTPHTLAVKGHEAWTVRQPWGACAFIFPWNFPFLLIGWGISPAWPPATPW